MTKIIGVTQLKGGAGRSTVSINLSAELSSQHQVTVIDCDLPQGTTSSWYALRSEIGKTGNLLLNNAENETELIDKVKRRMGIDDYIVIDAPPRIAEVTRAILILADLLIIPVASTAMDFWATQDLLDIVNDASKHNESLTYKILWNRFRSIAKSTNQLKELVNDAEYPVLKTTLGLRTAYPDSIAEGLSVSEYSDKKAAFELQELAKEIKQICN
jgi:chromosome partitioning protein